MAWTPPKVFEETNNVNSTVLNQYLSDNDRYLFRRPRHIINLRDTGNFTTTSSSFVVVDSTTLRLSVTVQAEADYRIWLNGGFNVNNSNIRQTKWDILQDNTTYLSSGTGTALTNGLSLITNSATSSGRNLVHLDHVIENLSAGTHFFDLYYAISASTLVLYTNPRLQFGIMEV
jgi:glycogen debranching enzyme